MFNSSPLPFHEIVENASLHNLEIMRDALHKQLAIELDQNKAESLFERLKIVKRLYKLEHDRIRSEFTRG